MKKKITAVLIIILIVLIGIFIINTINSQLKLDLAAWAKEISYKIFVNGHPSKIKPVKQGEKEYLPLHFPLEKGEQTWQVKLKYDPDTKTVKVEKVKPSRNLRGEEKCFFCEGTGDCMDCYPPGSGKAVNGEPCVSCEGTGKCPYCGGDGKR